MGKTITFRNLKQINVEEFGSTLNLGHIKNMKDLELVNRTYQEQLSRLLNHLAPEKTKLLLEKRRGYGLMKIYQVSGEYCEDQKKSG